MLCWLSESIGFRTAAYDSARAFLESYVDRQPGCLLLDVRMPGMNGLELQERLLDRSIDLPVIIVTGHGDVPMAVRAIKAGAFDFIEKPFDNQTLIGRIKAAVDEHLDAENAKTNRAVIEARLATLSPREQEVLNIIVNGETNRVIGDELGISKRTVEFHRANIMRKLEARSLADLIRATRARRILGIYYPKCW